MDIAALILTLNLGLFECVSMLELAIRVRDKVRELSLDTEGISYQSDLYLLYASTLR